MPASVPAKERIAENQRRYREAHREEINARNRTRMRQYYEANRERELDRNRRWTLANKSRRRQNGRESARLRRAANPEGEKARQQRNRMLSVHGMRPEDWAALWDAQDGRCYLCANDLDPAQIHVDHDHRCCPRRKSCSYCRRGLACSACNQLIGLAQDDPGRLRQIAGNLEAALAAAAVRMAARPEQLGLAWDDADAAAAAVEALPAPARLHVARTRGASQ